MASTDDATANANFDHQDENPMLKYLQSNSALRALLRDPAVQERFVWLLQDEKRHLERASARASHHHHNKAGFPNPNHAPISPLETKIIQGEESEEQKALRLLLKDLLGQE